MVSRGLHNNIINMNTVLTMMSRHKQARPFWNSRTNLLTMILWQGYILPSPEANAWLQSFSMYVAAALAYLTRMHFERLLRRQIDLIAGLGDHALDVGVRWAWSSPTLNSPGQGLMFEPCSVHSSLIQVFSFGELLVLNCVSICHNSPEAFVKECARVGAQGQIGRGDRG